MGRELVSTVRALRQRGLGPDPERRVGRAAVPAGSVLDDDLHDRPLTGDAAAAELLDRFTDIWRGSAA